MLNGFLAPTGAGSGLQALVPEGMRAITVEVNEFSGVAGMLIPGCRVDVLATIQDDNGDNTLARTIVEDVKVTAVGRAIGAREEGAEMFRSVTLVVTPKDAEAVELAATTGRPRLVLRSPMDVETGNGGNGITVAELRGKSNLNSTDPFSTPVIQMTLPATQPAEVEKNERLVAIQVPARRAVQIIRAGVESQVTFEIRQRPGKGLMTDNEMEPVTQ